MMSSDKELNSDSSSPRCRWPIILSKSLMVAHLVKDSDSIAVAASHDVDDDGRVLFCGWKFYNYPSAVKSDTLDHF